MAPYPSLFVVEDEHKTRDLVSAFLTYQGYEVHTETADFDVFEGIRSHGVEIVIANEHRLQYLFPDFLDRALALCPHLSLICYRYPGQPSIIPAGHDCQLSLSGALDLKELESLMVRAREYQAKLRAESPALIKISPLLTTSMVGRSPLLLELFELLEKVAESSATVLIQGESGTGKELVARAIHQLSTRKSKNFVPVNCAAIPDDLMESELFGHVKGSFTGAYASRAGRFEMADKGTLFLDEIGDMKAHLQIKLLRVLQNREFEPVGGTKSQKVDVRILAATNKNLEQMVANRQFREDLYYRLSVIPVLIPPLRERRDDIPLLIHSFLDRFNRDRKHAVTGFSREAMEVLCSYDWPGNVRELENLVERMVILKDSGLVLPDDLPERYLLRQRPVKTTPMVDGDQLPESGICLNSAVEEFENRLIVQALTRTGGNKKEAAMLLNLKRTTLIEKLKKKELSYGGEVS